MNIFLSKLFDNIVGFRSRNNKKMAVATMYYLFVISFGFMQWNLCGCLGAVLLPTIIVSFWEAAKSRVLKKALPAAACIVIFALIAQFAPVPADDEAIVSIDKTMQSGLATDKKYSLDFADTKSDADILLSDKTHNKEDLQTVYIGKTGSKYHRENCGSLKGKGTPISIDEALLQGREPCKVCVE